MLGLLKWGFDHYPLLTRFSQRHKQSTPITPHREHESRFPTTKGADLQTVYALSDFEVMAFYDHQRYAQVVRYGEMLLHAEPRNAWAWYLVAWAHWRLGHAVTANRHLAQACRVGNADACRLARQSCQAREPGACGDLTPLAPPSPPDKAHPTDIEALLRYGGRPLHVPPNALIYLTLSWQGGESAFPLSLHSPHLRIEQVPRGDYSLTLHVDQNGNQQPDPGDWYFHNRISTRTAPPVWRLELARVLHLVAPVDTAQAVPEMPDTGNPDLPIYHSPVRFAWEALDMPGVHYDYTVLQVTPPPGVAYQKVLAQGSTTATHFTLPLPPTPPGSAYLLLLTARRDDQTVGLLASHTSSWWGWGVYFRVDPTTASAK